MPGLRACAPPANRKATAAARIQCIRRAVRREDCWLRRPRQAKSSWAAIFSVVADLYVPAPATRNGAV